LEGILILITIKV